MIEAAVKLKLGLIATLVLFGISMIVTNPQLLTLYTIDIKGTLLNFIADLQIASFLLLTFITYKLWKYNELCKECLVQKEMVKERIE